MLLEGKKRRGLMSSVEDRMGLDRSTDVFSPPASGMDPHVAMQDREMLMSERGQNLKKRFKSRRMMSDSMNQNSFGE